MRVNLPALNAYTNVASAPKKSEGTTSEGGDRTPRGAGSGDSATVAISAEARKLAEARASQLREGDVDLEKVAALRAKLERGDFKIDSRLVAERLLDEMGWLSRRSA